MFTPTPSLPQRLDNDLVLKTVSSAADIERLAAFNGAMHDEGVAPLTRNLILRHPYTRPEQWPFIEDEATGVIVSTLCLIPGKWHYDEVELLAGEMGIVGTLAEYRHRGLIRILDRYLKSLLAQGKYDLSQIQGIPYFYRQFGYEYAIPLEGGWRVELYAIPANPPGAETFTFRPAAVADIPALLQFYEAAAQDLRIGALRDAAIWRYLLGPSTQTGTAAETWLVLDARQQPVGYWRIGLYGFGEGLIVNESSRLSHTATLAVLAYCKKLTLERGKPYIRLNLPAQHELVQTARRLDAHDLSTYAWQIHLPNIPQLLRKLAPVLERRLADSPFAGLTQTVVIDLYREAFELGFVAGKLTGVKAVGFRDGGDIRLPPPLLAPLVLGYRSCAELAQVYPDVRCWGQAQYLIDVLFPKVAAFIYPVY